MSPPLAYFLSWTCYGQRLHGDARGSVDDQHNRRGTPKLPRDARREDSEKERMLGPIVELSSPMRAVADRAIEQLCIDRCWRLMAQNVRPTHVHVVVNCRALISPERAMADLKARITRDLRRACLAAPDAQLWTKHGSTRWINHEPGLYGAIVYVNEWQSGPNREVLEEHKHLVRERIRSLRDWLASQGLPEDGRGVVAGESAQDRERRFSAGQAASASPAPFADEPGTK